MRKNVFACPPIPRVGEGKRGETGHIGYLLRQACTAYRILMEKTLVDLGVTPPQFSVLTMIASYPGVSGADLARLSLLTPQTVSVIVNNLEKAGWVARRPHDQHGRIQVLEITDAGKELLLRCNALVHAAETRLMDGLDPADDQVIRRWLVSVAVPGGS